MSPGKLIVVSGPAAVGKSTLTKALQAALGRDGDLWLLVELDVFARSVPRHWIAWDGRRGRFADLGFSCDKIDDGSVQLTLGADGRRVLAAFHRSVAAIVASGVNVVCEAIVHDAEDWRDWSEALGHLSAVWVRLTAPIDVLEGRERANPTRVFQGLARGMATRDPAGRFDIEADTSAEETSALVESIVARVRG